MIKLMKHQLRAKEMFLNKSIILNHEMGTGKTITGISIHQKKGAIIFCPAKLKKVWLKELIVMGEIENDIQIIETAKDKFENKKWLICSYSMVDKVVKYADYYKGMICDESHYLKGKSKRAIAVVNISEKMNVCTLLSGTSIMNKVIELWNQLLIIKAPVCDKYSRTAFSAQFCGGHMKRIGRNFMWWEAGATNLDLLKIELEGSIDIVKKKDVLELDPKEYRTFEITLDKQQRKIYANKWNEYIDWVKNNPEYSNQDLKNIKNAKQLVELGKLKQVTSLIKVENFLENIESLGEQQAIVFVEYKESIELLNKGLKKLNIKYSTLKDKGSIEQFQQKKVQIFTANIISGGQGLNLQNASNIFILDRHWTPAQNQQAEDRIHRNGQLEQCTIYYYHCVDTVDDLVKKANKKKQSLIDKIL